MTEATTKTCADFVLPPSVVSRLDVSRLVREVEQIDNAMTTAAVRTKVGAEPQPVPAVSEALDEFLAQNSLSLTNSQERSNLVKQLQQLKDKVPIIHMTFAVPADRESLGELAAWLRQSIHPQAVIAVGLQPALIAGVYLRTPNHVHDFSMRAALSGGHGILIDELEKLRGSK